MFVFEFDSTKSAANLAKHGIDFEQAQTLWNDDKRIEIPTRQGNDEERWAVIGSIANRIWVAVVTYRDSGVRIISVRRARDNEEQAYEHQDD